MNIIVTGASKGIGYEAVKLFAMDRANHIVAIARNQKFLDDLAADCSREGLAGRVTVMPFDLINEDIAGKLVPVLSGIFNGIDILVNNAGHLVNKAFDQLTNEDFDEIFNVNVKAPFILIRELLPYFFENAHIVNIGSMGGFQGSAKFKGLSLYSSSKGALAILTECLAEEMKERKIFVNCLALGSARTEMFSKAFPGYKSPLSAKDMARFLVDFSMKGHEWFNGKILPVSIATP